MKYFLSAIALLASLSTFAAPYSLENYKVDAYIERTIFDTDFGIGRIYGYGLDNPFFVQAGADDARQYSNMFRLNVDKDRFTIDFINSSSWQEGIIFRLEQPDYVETTGADFWSSLAAETNIEGLGINIGYGWVELNLGNTRFNQDSYFVGYLNYKESVPEPASYVLLLLGVVGIYLITSYKNRKYYSGIMIKHNELN